MFACVCLCVSVCVCGCRCVSVCLCVCVSVCVSDICRALYAKLVDRAALAWAQLEAVLGFLVDRFQLETTPFQKVNLERVHHTLFPFPTPQFCLSFFLLCIGSVCLYLCLIF
jgi:hypothetical protein